MNIELMKTVLEYAIPKYAAGLAEFHPRNLPQADKAVEAYNENVNDLRELATLINKQINTGANNSELEKDCDTLCFGILRCQEQLSVVGRELAAIRKARIEELAATIDELKAPIIDRYDAAGVHESLFDQAFMLDDEIKPLIDERDIHLRHFPINNELQAKAFEYARHRLEIDGKIGKKQSL